MKKSLLALAVAGALSGSAFAQSSVTLFGIVDTNFGYLKGDNNGNVKVLGNSGINSSRIGFRGTEDLGGLKANFWIEGGINTDDGTAPQNANTNNQASGVSTGSGLVFGRRMFAGLSGGFGEVRLGREYTPLFFMITTNDPFGTNGVGDTKIYATTGVGGGLIQTTVRASNSVSYLLPSGIGGVYGHFMYALGENASTAANKDDGTYSGARVGWAGGPVDVSVAYARSELLQSPTQGNYTAYGIGGSVKFGGFKPMFMYVKHELDVATGADPERDDFLVGLVWTIGNGDLRFSYNSYDVDPVVPPGTLDDAKQFAVGYVHNLSRRTALYAQAAQMDNDGAGTAFSNGRATTRPGGKTQGYQLGIRHIF